MQKMLICAVFCVAVFSIVQSAANPPVNAIWGARQPNDERLLYKIVEQDSGWFFTKAVEDVDYPGKVLIKCRLCQLIRCLKSIFESDNFGY